MRKVWRFSAALSLAALAGCSSSGSWLSSPFGLGKSNTGARFSDAPAFDQNYGEVAKAQADRNVASPGLGLDNDVEPGTMGKLTNSVTNNPVSKGIKSAWAKTTRSTSEMFTTRKGPPPTSISLAVETGEPDAELFVAIARMEEAKGNFPGAEKQYQLALKDDPKYQPALIGMARLHDREGDLGKATAYYQRAVKAHPDDATAHNDLGLCYARQNRLPEAAQSLERAVALAPKKALYRNNIATVLVEMGQLEPALGHLSAVHQPGTAHYNIACLLYERGRSEQALEHFSLAYAQDPQMVEARDWAAKLQQELGGGGRMELAQASPADEGTVTATDQRYAAQAPVHPVAPALTPSWASAVNPTATPAVAPSPDQANGYTPAEPDPAAYQPAPGESTYRLPPVDTAYMPSSRY